VGAAGTGGRASNLGEQEIAWKMTGQADALGDAGEERGEGGSEGVRQDVCNLNFKIAEGLNDGFHATAIRGEGQYASGRGVHGPQGGESRLGEQGQIGLAMVITKGLNGGHGHDRIAQPVKAADEDAGAGWKRGGHQV